MATNFSATWMTTTGHPIDSDHLLVIPDPEVPVGTEALAFAGQGLDKESIPAPGFALIAVSLALVALVVRSGRLVR